MKGYVEDAIKDAIGGEISRINDEIMRRRTPTAERTIIRQETPIANVNSQRRA